MRILLVEDDDSLGNTIQEWLRLDDYIVDWFQDGESASNALLTQKYDCILLDRGLPKLSGDDLLKNMRQYQLKTPTLIITAMGALQDKIQGLDLGADDYLVKPFELEELSARLRVINRRLSQACNNLSQHDHVNLDILKKIAYCHGKTVFLTAKEFQILKTLMLYPEQIFTRQQLEDKLYSWSTEVESNAVEVHIHHLRKKLDEPPRVSRRPNFLREYPNEKYLLT